MGSAKTTDSQAHAVVALLADGIPRPEIVARVGLSSIHVVNDIASGRYWRHIPR